MPIFNRGLFSPPDPGIEAAAVSISPDRLSRTIQEAAKEEDKCTTVVQIDYDQVMQSKRKSTAPRKTASVRQSVTIPAQLAREVRRVARERNVTMSRALVTLAERGVEAEAAARAKLTTAYENFMAERDPARKSEVGEDLIRAIFGRAAIAEDPLP